MPSLLYVGVSRVKRADCLQVLDFHPSQLLKSDPKVIQQCSSSIGETSPDMECCKMKILEDDSLFCAYDRFESEEGGLHGLYIKKSKSKTNKQTKKDFIWSELGWKVVTRARVHFVSNNKKPPFSFPIGSRSLSVRVRTHVADVNCHATRTLAHSSACLAI